LKDVDKLNKIEINLVNNDIKEDIDLVNIVNHVNDENVNFTGRRLSIKTVENNININVANNINVEENKEIDIMERYNKFKQQQKEMIENEKKAKLVKTGILNSLQKVSEKKAFKIQTKIDFEYEQSFKPKEEDKKNRIY